MAQHLAPLRPGVALALGFGILGMGTPSYALDPWFDHIYPRYFFSGFEQSDTEGFFPTPTDAWYVENGNTYAVEDLGCDTPAHSWVQSGFVWFDYILQVSVQERAEIPLGTPIRDLGSRGDCSAVGIHFRRTDFDNYYMFVLRGGDEAVLLRVQDGVVDRELSVPYTYSANRWYVLRVKVEGDHILGYVNGRPTIEWNDDTHVRGTGGATAWGTEAWFDNVISMPIYPTPHSGRPPVQASPSARGAEIATAAPGIDAWPQPSNGLASLRFTLPEAANVEVEIFDANGRRVRALLDGSLSSGTHDLLWDGRDEFGAATSAGIYYARLVTRDQVSTGRIVRVR